MKKLIALALTFCMIFTLAACSSGSSETWEDELGTKGKLRVGMAADYPPYESYDAQGNVVGFDADIAAYIAEKLGVELEIVPMDFDTIISAVTAGTVDMGISCFSYTEERAQSVLFTETYMTSAQACFASTEYGINSMEDLAGGLVGAGNGTTGMEVAEELSSQYGYSTQPGEIAVMSESVKAGAMQAIITEQCVANSYINANPGKFQMIEEALTEEEIKAITNKSNEKLLEEVNKIITDFTSSPDYDQMVIDWFG